RRLDRPILNFGFSGNGRMEIEVGRYIAEMDAEIFVIDCVANTDANLIIKRAVPLVVQLRSIRAKAPILLLDERCWDNAALVPSLLQRHKDKSDALRRAYDELLAEGIQNIHYRGAEDVL